MCKRLIYLTSFVLVMFAAPLVTHAQVENLLLNPSFEEDEVILNDPAWEQWTTWGYESGLGSTVEFDETEFIDGTRSLRVDPTGDTNWYFIVLQDYIPLVVGTEYTASFWAKAEEPRPISAKFKATDNSIDWSETNFELTTEWAEYTFTTEAQNAEIKLEIFCSGVEIPLWLDFVFIYEGEYVAGIEPSFASPQVKATDPDPADGAWFEQTWGTLSWRPGAFAVSHDVYLGDNFDDVNEGTAETFQGNQLAASFLVGFPGFPYPDGLIPGTTYYWRIDEVNDTDPNSPWKGDVWSFTVSPMTAYIPDPADGAESVNPNVRLSWTAGFGAKLHTVYFGEDFDDVNTAAGGLPQGATTYTPGPLELTKTYYWRVDEFDGIDTYKGDVWSFTTEGAVGNPNPSNGAVDVERTPILTWSPGVYAASHQLYFGTDEEAVKNADTGSPEYKGTRALGSESYDPGKLELNATYYWRIDEVNNVNPDSPWTGSLWSFTTVDSILIDDIEDYNDYPPDEIFSTWIDGWEVPTNGSMAGHADPPFAETDNVHGGTQSMPVYYENNFKYSEVTMTLVLVRDWTEEGVGVLSLWFYGDVANAAERMYVNLNGIATVYHNDPRAALIEEWTEWTIDLQEFAAQGVNLTNVNTISIGFGDKNNLQAGGTGMVLFDDIRLYRPAQ
jgi:hypothetical protein